MIDRYIGRKPDYQDFQMGSTFFNTGYIDYLDENYKEEAGKAKVNQEDLEDMFWQ